MKFNVGEATRSWAEKSKIPIYFSQQSTSTNALAKEADLDENSPIALFVTEHQTQGRGRNDNQWQDLSGDALLSSWVFQMYKDPQPILSCMVGLAVYNAFSLTWPYLNWSLKAPNDLFLGQHKVGGLLIENLNQGAHNRFIIGLGVNIFAHPPLATATDLTTGLASYSAANASATNLSVGSQEWQDLLDRLLLELSLAVSNGSQSLSNHQSFSILTALNQRPGLDEKYLALDAKGNLLTSKRSIHWSEL